MNKAAPYIERMNKAAGKLGRQARLMEVCGTHTHVVARNGLRSLFPENVELVSGPGCPVCVTPQEDVQRMILLARMSNTTICTFGDMLRVPGLGSSLEIERAAGADIDVVYSPEEALKKAGANPDRNIVFLAVGFETTAPVTAAIIEEALQSNLKNFCAYVSHKLITPAMKIVMDGESEISGFLTPGHVSVIIGSDAYASLATEYSVPCVVTGFEPVDVLEGMAIILEKLEQQVSGSFSQYKRVVRPQGNPRALGMMAQFFEVVDANWRGLGTIPKSGLELKDEYAFFDAAKRFELPEIEGVLEPECGCGLVLKGLMQPRDCPMFGSKCTPTNPQGPCMVSSEGSCAARYKYGQ